MAIKPSLDLSRLEGKSVSLTSSLPSPLLPTVEIIRLANNQSEKSKEKVYAVKSTATAAEPQDVDDHVTAEKLATGRRNFGMLDAPYKMILCVNMSLRDGKGGNCDARRKGNAGQDTRHVHCRGRGPHANRRGKLHHVLGVGPAPVKVIDSIASHPKLL